MINTTAVFEHLRERAERDSAVASDLRRSLSFDPGTYAPVFPLLEPLVGQSTNRSRERVYLVAGFWGLAVRRGTGGGRALPEAVRSIAHGRSSKSVEARFVSLLDSDGDELVWRLRHVVDLIASHHIAIDWPTLLGDVLAWDSESRHVQQRWAREFWRNDPPPQSPPAEAIAATQPTTGSTPEE